MGMLPDGARPKAINPLPDDPVTELISEDYSRQEAHIKKYGMGREFLIVPSAGVLFKKEQSELLPYYRRILDSFVRLYKLSDGTSSILVEGYSSDANNETRKNPRLSRERAKAVADYLKSKGIPGDKIEIRGYGDSEAGSGIFDDDVNCEDSQCFRRVNVSIQE